MQTIRIGYFLCYPQALLKTGYQLKLPINIETIIPEDNSVRLPSQFVEAMNLTGLYVHIDDSVHSVLEELRVSGKASANRLSFVQNASAEQQQSKSVQDRTQLLHQ